MNFRFSSLIVIWFLNHISVYGEQKRNVIVNGITPEQSRYPYVASLQYGRKHICGATLIAPDIILTAAHCVTQPELIGHFRVVVGEYHLQDHMDTGETFYIENMDTHPQYIVTNTYVDNDAMIMKISGRSYHEPVMLNIKHNVPTKDNRLTVMGWGSVDVKGEYLSNVLQEVDLNYLFKWECKKEGIQTVTNNMLCAFDQDLDNISEDSCYGDSGGPLIIKKDNAQDLQVGIVSYGTEICAEHPGIYTRISSIYDWIRYSTCQLSDDPPDYFDCGAFSNHLKDIGLSTDSPSLPPTDSPSVSPTAAQSSWLPSNLRLVSETEVNNQVDEDNENLIAASFLVSEDEDVTNNALPHQKVGRSAFISILSTILILLI
jgi:secreted trypsin-like serine protease